MNVVIKEYGPYREEEILALYRQVGWTNYTDRPDMLKRAFANSLKILGAYENQRLLGLIRVVGDGHSVILIQDLLVLPEYQRQGIGTALLKQVLQDYKQVYQTHVYTDRTEKTVSFYKSLGFVMDADMNCCALSIYS